MTLTTATSVLTLLVALRVLIPDLRALCCRLLGAGVRVGARTLVDQHRAGRPESPAGPRPRRGAAERGPAAPRVPAPREDGSACGRRRPDLPAARSGLFLGTEGS